MDPAGEPTTSEILTEATWRDGIEDRLEAVEKMAQATQRMVYRKAKRGDDDPDPEPEESAAPKYTSPYHAGRQT